MRPFSIAPDYNDLVVTHSRTDPGIQPPCNVLIPQRSDLEVIILDLTVCSCTNRNTDSVRFPYGLFKLPYLHQLSLSLDVTLNDKLLGNFTALLF